jgi:hypothetical protein
VAAGVIADPAKSRGRSRHGTAIDRSPMASNCAGGKERRPEPSVSKSRR